MPEVQIGLLIGAMLAVRLAVAKAALLSGDEAYYWTWSRDLQLSYYDHPGMVAYWIAAATAVLGDTAIGVRLPAPLAAAAATWLVYDATRVAFGSARTGLTAALWLNATLLFSAAGVIMTPDAPLVLFWSLALWALIRLFNRGRARHLYVAALALGLGALSKYTTALIVPGAIAALLISPDGRRWWRTPHPYLAAVLAAACAAPVVIWNMDHQWASFAKQFAHAFGNPSADPAKSAATFIGGQIGVVTPLIFAFCLWGGAWAIRAGWKSRRGDWFLLGATSLPVVLYFIDRSLNGMVQAHWAGPAYIGGCMAAAGCRSVADGGKRTLGRLSIGALVLGAAVVAVTYLQTATAVLPLPIKADPTKRLGGWTTLAAAVEAERTAHPGAFLFVANHELAGLLSFYLAGHPKVFTALTAMRPAGITADDVSALGGRDAILVTTASDRLPARLGRYFDGASPLGELEVRWGRQVSGRYALYLGRHYRGGLFIRDGFRGRPAAAPPASHSSEGQAS